MIQRIQSVFLLLVSIFSILLLFLPFEQFNHDNAVVSINLLGLNYANGVRNLLYVPVLVNLLILVFSLLTIFQFKNRIKQIKMARGLLFMAVMLLSSLFSINFFHVEGGSNWERTYLWPCFLPTLSVIAAFMAMKAIKKDEELVRSADRIR